MSTRKKSPGALPKSGRPHVVWDAARLADVESLAGFGLNIEQVAGFFGLREAGIKALLKRRPEIRDAIESGRAKAAARVTKTAYELATSGKCPAMTMFWCKTRLGWREVDRLEHSGPGGGPIPQTITVKLVRPKGSVDDGKDG